MLANLFANQCPQSSPSATLRAPGLAVDAHDALRRTYGSAQGTAHADIRIDDGFGTRLLLFGSAICLGARQNRRTAGMEAQPAGNTLFRDDLERDLGFALFFRNQDTGSFGDDDGRTVELDRLADGLFHLV